MLTFLTTAALGLLIGMSVGVLIGSLLTYFYMRRQLYKVRDYAMSKAKGAAVDALHAVPLDDIFSKIKARRKA